MGLESMTVLTIKMLGSDAQVRVKHADSVANTTFLACLYISGGNLHNYVFQSGRKRRIEEKDERGLMLIFYHRSFLHCQSCSWIPVVGAWVQAIYMCEWDIGARYNACGSEGEPTTKRWLEVL